VTTQRTNHSVTGVVVGNNGRPVGGAQIFVESGPSHPDLVSESNSEGRFHLSNLSPGRYVISATTSDGRTGSVQVRLTGGKDASTRIQLGGSSQRPEPSDDIDELRGDEPQERPIPEERDRPPMPSRRRIPTVDTTVEDGIEELPGDESFENPLPEQRAGYDRSSVKGTRDIPGVIRGVVLSPDGRPLASAKVLIEGTFAATVTSDERGQFLLTGLLPGRYALRATAAASAVVSLSGGTEDWVEIRLSVGNGGRDLSSAMEETPGRSKPSELFMPKERGRPARS
jgi:protocatechuate 3,4-dioxygenase beta subunit